MNSRKLAALRALAERPGTEAEGAVAREMLKRMEAKGRASSPRSVWDSMDAMLSGSMSKEDFQEVLRRFAQQRRDEPLADFRWKCACGLVWQAGQKCKDTEAHAKIQEEIRTRFKRGDSVFYNKWAYSINCHARVTGYCNGPENGDYPWAWIGLKFDHLESYRQVPIYTAKGWHLSKDQKFPEVTDILCGL